MGWLVGIMLAVVLIAVVFNAGGRKTWTLAQFWEVKKTGRAYKLGEFYYIGNGRSGTLGNENGLVRMLSEAESGQVLGVHIIGPQATELIALATLAMQNGISIEGIKKTVFPHPTLSETFFEAALASDGEAIHLLLDQVEGEVDD